MFQTRAFFQLWCHNHTASKRLSVERLHSRIGEKNRDLMLKKSAHSRDFYLTFVCFKTWVCRLNHLGRKLGKSA